MHMSLLEKVAVLDLVGLSHKIPITNGLSYSNRSLSQKVHIVSMALDITHLLGERDRLKE